MLSLYATRDLRGGCSGNISGFSAKRQNSKIAQHKDHLVWSDRSQVKVAMVRIAAEKVGIECPKRKTRI